MLHNYCERNKSYGLNEEEVVFQIQRHQEEESTQPNLPDQVYSHKNSKGELVRSVLTEYIIHNLPDSYIIKAYTEKIHVPWCCFQPLPRIGKI